MIEPEQARFDTLDDRFIEKKNNYFNRVSASLNLADWAIDACIAETTREHYENRILTLRIDKLHLKGVQKLATVLSVLDEALGEKNGQPSYLVTFSEETLGEEAMNTVEALQEADEIITATVFKGLVE